MDYNFQPGDVVSYCGEEATVIVNYGTSGSVEVKGEGRMSWHWQFDGEPVKLVRRAIWTRSA